MKANSKIVGSPTIIGINKESSLNISLVTLFDGDAELEDDESSDDADKVDGGGTRTDVGMNDFEPVGHNPDDDHTAVINNPGTANLDIHEETSVEGHDDNPDELIDVVTGIRRRITNHDDVAQSHTTTVFFETLRPEYISYHPYLNPGNYLHLLETSQHPNIN